MSVFRALRLAHFSVYEAFAAEARNKFLLRFSGRTFSHSLASELTFTKWCQITATSRQDRVPAPILEFVCLTRLRT
jgi:hypothetical protein